MRTYLLSGTLCASVVLMGAAQDQRVPTVKGLIPYWTGIRDETGRCRYSIPPTWKTDGLGGNEIARSPDGSVTLEQWWLPADWLSYKADVRHQMRPTVVHEDSAQRLSFDYAGGWPGDHVLVAIPASTGVCTTRIDIRPGARALLKSTIETIIHTIVAPD